MAITQMYYGTWLVLSPYEWGLRSARRYLVADRGVKAILATSRELMGASNQRTVRLK